MGSIDLRSIACGYQAYKHAAGSPLSAFNFARSSSREEIREALQANQALVH